MRRARTVSPRPLPPGANGSTAAAALTSESVGTKHLQPKKRSFLFGAAGYLLGVLIGAVYPVWLVDRSSFLTLFLQHYLDRFCTAHTAGQLLGRHLSLQLLALLLVAFGGCSLLGAPVLLLFLAGKGLLNGAVYTCVLTGQYPITPRQFFLTYILYNFGSSVLVFWSAGEALIFCTALFRTHFQSRPHIQSPGRYLERFLIVLLLTFLWGLLVWGVSRPFFSATA